MFTGIVTALGTIEAVVEQPESARLTIAGINDNSIQLGDSVAVDGVCLTVAELHGESFTADLLPETRQRTTLGEVAIGRRVNLELAATPSSRLGGHIVQGHIDGVGQIRRRSPGDAWDDVVIALPGDLPRYVAMKGSIALDGVSLTVVDIEADEVTVSLIPETLRRTTFGFKDVGDPINVEVDVIAKYVERLLATRPVSVG
jgi:riboflavin synthase